MTFRDLRPGGVTCDRRPSVVLPGSERASTTDATCHTRGASPSSCTSTSTTRSFLKVSCDLSSRSGVDEIFFSLHSLDAPETVDEFKLRMSLMAKPVRQRVVLHPWLQPFTTRRTHALGPSPARAATRAIPSAKAEGMLRFYLEGMQPLEAQQWPACLSEYRARLTAIPAPDREDAASEHEIRTREAFNLPGSVPGGARHEAA